jgi:hypothetical protein
LLPAGGDFVQPGFGLLLSRQWVGGGPGHQ